MKRLTTLVLGVTLVLGTTALSFAAQAKADANQAATTTKTKKHHKKGAKKHSAKSASTDKAAK